MAVIFEFEAVQKIIKDVQILIEDNLNIWNKPNRVGIFGDYADLFRWNSLIIILLVVFGNYFFGRKVGAVSKGFPLYTTPPSPFFSIWGIIFIGLISITAYNIPANTWNLKMYILFAFSSICNVVWVFVFSCNTKTTNFISLLLIGCIWIANYLHWDVLGQIPMRDAHDMYWNHPVRNMLSFYMGWLTAAFHLNLGVVLVYSCGMSKKFHMYFFWITLGLTVAFLSYYNCIVLKEAQDSIGMFISLTYAIIGALITSVKSVKNEKQFQKIDTKQQ